MQGQLNEHQIDNLLLSQSIGRLGCVNGIKPYVIPITFLYDGVYIYSQTNPGLKLDIMRKHPLVCFEVDRHTDMFNWQSAIVWGTFEELSEKEAARARTPLFESVFQFLTETVIHPFEHETAIILEEDSRYKPIVFRIKIAEKTGRFRKSQHSG